MRQKLIFLSLVVYIFSIPLKAYSQEFKKSFQDWSVYTAYQSGQKLCYMVSFPTNKTGNYTRRGDPYVMVTSIGGDRDEFSITSGYPYKKGTEPRAVIDGKEYRLSMTEGEFAWFKTEQYDRKAVQKMKKGMKMRIKGTSPKGTYSIDTYSLRGFTAAYNKMHSLCR
jgi:invasion protein IalB